MKTTKFEKQVVYRIAGETMQYVGVVCGGFGFQGASDAVRVFDPESVHDAVCLTEAELASVDESIKMKKIRNDFLNAKGRFLDRMGYTPR